MAPYEGPRHPGMVLHCEVADAALAGGQASLASRGRAPRGARGASRLGALVLDSLQTAASGSHVGGSDRFDDDNLPAGYHLVRCIYSDEMLRERLSHPQVLSTTLTANYRSHPTLLMLPSLLFYGGSLESRAPPALTSSCLSWSWLSRGAVTPSDSGTPPSTHNGGGGGFPLLCLGVAGDDSHLVDSPSFWNLAEIEYVCAAITSLIEESRRAGAPLTALDVGVISPYRQQVLRLRRALRCVPTAWCDVVHRRVYLLLLHAFAEPLTSGRCLLEVWLTFKAVKRRRSSSQLCSARITASVLAAARAQQLLQKTHLCCFPVLLGCSETASRLMLR